MVDNPERVMFDSIEIAESRSTFRNKSLDFELRLDFAEILKHDEALSMLQEWLKVVELAREGRYRTTVGDCNIY